MNLRKQVEPLKKAALQASSLQRHAHHAASRLTWVKRWLKRAYRHHAQSRELKPSAASYDAMRTRSSRRSSSPARSASAPDRSRLASRHRNSSSATFSAARTATRSASLFGVESAAERIFSST